MVAQEVSYWNCVIWKAGRIVEVGRMARYTTREWAQIRGRISWMLCVDMLKV